MDKKIIIVNARFLTQSITGVQRYGIEISRNLKKISKNNQLIFVTPYNIINKEYAKELDAVIIGKHTGHLWEQIDLPLYLRKIGSPLLLCLANTAPIFYKYKISTIHDVAFKVYPQTFNKTFLYTYQLLIPQILKSSKHVLTVSNFSKKEINKYYHTNLNKISVIPNAVNEDFIYTKDDNLKNTPYFLAVSSINYRKNFHAVLKAFDIFTNKTTINYKLFIIGDLNCSSFNGIDLSSFKKNPNIVFLGRVSDKELIHYYSNAIAFIYPSLYEGFGIPPLEAQACMCPVLSSTIEPLKEVLEDSALYADPYKAEDLANQMIILTHEYQRNKLKQLGKENIKRFSWHKSAMKLKEILYSYL